VHLDTDIGDDIDDAFCLALLLSSPEIALKSVSTVFMDTSIRADLVSEMCKTAGQTPVICEGLRGVMASKPVDVSKRKPNHLASHHYDRPQADVLAVLDRARHECDAVLTIGPMTDLAASLLANPDPTCGRIISMAAEFERPRHIEWNVRVDPEAAHVCFASAIAIDFIPWSIGPAVKLRPADIDQIRASSKPIAKLLLNHLEQFWREVPNKTNMYDPMTVVALLKPELFDWQRGVVSVELRGEQTYGLTNFRRDDSGPHRVAMGVKADEARAFMVDRITK
jgi:inosine-uridine nucleoside N-ribohydrolase